MKFKTRNIAAAVVVTTGAGLAGPAWADGGGVAAGLLGGMIVSRAVNESRNQQAYQSGYSAGSQPRTVVVQAPPAQSAPAQPSAESRLKKVDDLHKKGLISTKEAEAKKKAILGDI